MVIRFEPARMLMNRRQAMEELFKEFPLPFRLWTDEGAEQIPLDVYQNDKEIVVKASVSGVRPENIDIHVVGDTLVIKAEAMADAGVKEDEYLVKERRYGEFRRSMTLPTMVNAEKAEASFENGTLTLKLPKMRPEKPAQIKVNVKA